MPNTLSFCSFLSLFKLHQPHTRFPKPRSSASTFSASSMSWSQLLNSHNSYECFEVNSNVWFVWHRSHCTRMNLSLILSDRDINLKTHSLGSHRFVSISAATSHQTIVFNIPEQFPTDTTTADRKGVIVGALNKTHEELSHSRLFTTNNILRTLSGTLSMVCVLNSSEADSS